MALSYLSQPYKPEPYIQPFDLNLMAKVLSVEQGKFDAEGQKVQNQIDQFGSLDVIKGIDKQYLNDKINNLVGGINSLGGVNIGDQNVATQIEGMGSDIYGDDKIINAVASTRQIRSLQAGYSKLKSDPKLIKNYAPQNEAWDNRFVSSYLNDNKLGSSYSGPTTPSPYVNYRDSHLKAFNTIKANLTTQVTADGVNFINSEGKIIKPERIMAAAADLLLPQEKEQMEKDGWFAFKDANPLDVVQQSLDLNNQKLSNARVTKADYQGKFIAAANDPAAQATYKSLIDEEDKNIQSLTDASKKIQSTGLQEYTKNPEAYMGNVYKDQYYRGLGERFAYSEQTKKVTPNYGEIAAQKLAQAERFHQDEIDLKSLELGWKMMKDPTTGKLKKVPLTGAEDLNYPSVAGVNTEGDLDIYKKSEQVLRDQNKALDAEKASKWTSFFGNFLNEHEELRDILQSTESGTGVSARLKGEKVFEKNKIPGIQPDELNIDINNPKNIALGAKVGLTTGSLKTLKSLYDAYDQLTHPDRGAIDITKIPEKFPQVIKEMQIIDEKIKSNNAKIEGVNKIVSKKVNLTPQEEALLNEYDKNPKSFTKTINPSISGGGIMGAGVAFGNTTEDVTDPRLLNIFAKIRNSGVDLTKEKNAFYQQESNRPVYSKLVITNENKLAKNDYLQGVVQTYVEQNGDLNNAMKPGTNFNRKDVEIDTVGLNPEGTAFEAEANVTVGSGNKQQIIRVKVPLDAPQAAAVGLQRDPLQYLNESVYQSGSTNPLDIFIPKDPNPLNTTSTQVAAKVKIKKSDIVSREDQSAYAQILIKSANGHEQYIKIPGTDAPTPSVAYAAAESWLKALSLQGADIQKIYQLLAPKP